MTHSEHLLHILLIMWDYLLLFEESENYANNNLQEDIKQKNVSLLINTRQGIHFAKTKNGLKLLLDCTDFHHFNSFHFINVSYLPLFKQFVFTAFTLYRRTLYFCQFYESGFL